MFEFCHREMITPPGFPSLRLWVSWHYGSRSSSTLPSPRHSSVPLQPPPPAGVTSPPARRGPRSPLGQRPLSEGLVDSFGAFGGHRPPPGGPARLKRGAPLPSSRVLFLPSRCEPADSPRPFKNNDNMWILRRKYAMLQQRRRG